MVRSLSKIYDVFPKKKKNIVEYCEWDHDVPMTNIIAHTKCLLILRLTKSKNTTKKREPALKKRWRKWKMQLGQRSSIPAVYIALPSGG
jgi:hypothetical protein